MKFSEEISELSHSIRKNQRPENESIIKGIIDEELWDLVIY